MLGWHFKESSMHTLVFSGTLNDYLTGACNDVKASIIDKGSLSTSVLLSDGIESEANEK